MTKVKKSKVGTERMGDLPQLQSVGGVREVRGKRIGGSRTQGIDPGGRSSGVTTINRIKSVEILE